jgi:hypothetical protein
MTFAKYQSLHEQGHDAATTYKVLRADGLSQIEGIRMLREVFSLSLVDAQKLAHEADTGEAPGVSQPGLEKGFTDVLDDFFGEDEKSP